MTALSAFLPFLCLSALLTLADDIEETTYSYPSSCLDLDDGYYDLKLLEDDDYPVINQKCSNEYLILDYNHDSNVKEYFSSWEQLCSQILTSEKNIVTMNFGIKNI